MQIKVAVRANSHALLIQVENKARAPQTPVHRALNARHRSAQGKGFGPDQQRLTVTAFLNQGESIRAWFRPPNSHPELVYSVPRWQGTCLLDQSLLIAKELGMK